MNLEDRQDIILIEGARTGYSPEQVGTTLTVGELIEYLQDYDEDTPVMLCNDRGYTYGAITYGSIECGTYDEDGETVEAEMTGRCY